MDEMPAPGSSPIGHNRIPRLQTPKKIMHYLPQNRQLQSPELVITGIEEGQRKHGAGIVDGTQ
ncbi:hypothetical protein [Nonomuraea sp. PA05]|uniref:hypothetical protein n=1 Tax=Nonomuraea sp. PA05 TaxID=2604466 RepID=UPI0011DDFC8B|nr:hypothetical protein [Nonomuraea sp. PA05]